MHCVISFKNIKNIDDILPLIYELKKAEIITKPTFVASERYVYEFIRKNIVLYEGISSINGKLTYLYKYKNKYLNYFYNLAIYRHYIFRKVISIEMFTNKMLSILSAFNNNVWKGKKIYSMIFNRPMRQAKTTIGFYRSIREDFKIKENVIKGYDYILLSHNKEQLEEAKYEKIITDSEHINVGYTRGLEEWRKYLAKNINRFLPEEIKMPYMFFSIDIFGSWLTGEKCDTYDEKFKTCLNILKKYNNDIMTVFKPNQRIDIKKVHKILKNIGYKNYLITYTHPVILFQKAKFFFACFPTSLLIEAYYNGCPTVEYAHYDRRFYDYNKGQPMHLNCVDYFIHRDPEKLKKVLEGLIWGNINIKRNENVINTDFPVLSREEIREMFSFFN